MVIIAPSILSADYSQLQQQMEIAEAAGADWFHLDVMDGHFVPNITFGPLMVKAVRKLTKLPLDVHLMISDPDSYVESFRDAGADRITVHAEASVHLHRSVRLVKESGAKVGVALNPATPVSCLEEILAELDLVLIMSVNPGFGGQTFITSSVAKIKKMAEMVQAIHPSLLIEVDGGVDDKTAAPVVEAGARVLVAGSAIFGAADISKALKSIRNTAENALT
jgi:ribulose-phosphate 3-epimerase